MKVGDYVTKQRVVKNGKTITDKIVVSTTGVEYAIGPKFNSGGVAPVYRAYRVKDKKKCVFKEYVPSNKPEIMLIHRAIKKNIKSLIEKPIMESDHKTKLKSFVGPMDNVSLIELPESKGFGYIMELVDTKTFLSIPKIRHSKETYPDAKCLCKAFKNIADFFRNVHFMGWCYKDINEGNIYINPKTGDIKIIDCDNISPQSVKTVFGTFDYLAPEVYITETPDTYTDYFSMAVLFYRILIGGFPLDGKKTKEYLLKTNSSVKDSAHIIYGSQALFAFDPIDKSNSIYRLEDKDNPNLYKLQAKKWDNLPECVKNAFIQTFSTGLKIDNKHKRFKDKDWSSLFEELETNGLVKCKCGKYNFGSSTKENTCYYCGKKLPKITIPQKKQTSPIVQNTPNSKELLSVVLKVKRDVAPTNFSVEIKRKEQLVGNDIYPGLCDNWTRLEYSQAKNLLSLINLTNYTWIITDNGKNIECKPNERLILKKNLIITILRRQLQITVSETK